MPGDREPDHACTDHRHVDPASGRVPTRRRGHVGVTMTKTRPRRKRPVRSGGRQSRPPDRTHVPLPQEMGRGAAHDCVALTRQCGSIDSCSLSFSGLGRLRCALELVCVTVRRSLATRRVVQASIRRSWHHRRRHMTGILSRIVPAVALTLGAVGCGSTDHDERIVTPTVVTRQVTNVVGARAADRDCATAALPMRLRREPTPPSPVSRSLPSLARWAGAIARFGVLNANGVATVFGVLARRGCADRGWYRVQLPGPAKRRRRLGSHDGRPTAGRRRADRRRSLTSTILAVPRGPNRADGSSLDRRPPQHPSARST